MRTASFRRHRLTRFVAVSLVVALVAEMPASAVLQAAAQVPADSAQQAATALATKAFGAGAADWPAYQTGDGSVVVRSPDGQQVARVTPDGSNDLWQRDYRGRWEHGRMSAGVFLWYNLSTDRGTNTPPGASADVRRLPPLTGGASAQSAQGAAPTAPLPSVFPGPLEGPAGTMPLAGEEVRAWNANLYDEYRKLAARVTGDKDGQGRLLGINGQVIPTTTLIGLLLVRDAVIRGLEQQRAGLREIYAGKTDAEKAAIIRGLAAKARELRQAAAEYAIAERAFSVFQADRIRYEAQLKEADRLDALGRHDEADELRMQATDLNHYGKLLKAREKYVTLLQTNPLLALKVNDTFLYDSLGETPLTTDAEAVRRLNDYLLNGMVDARLEIERLSGLWDLESLAVFASPVYGAIQTNFSNLGASMGSPLLVDLMNELAGAAEASLVDWTDRAWANTFSNPLVIGALLLGSLFVPILAAGLTTVQLYEAGSDVVVAMGDAETARAQAAAIGWTPVLGAEAQVSGAVKQAFITVPLSLLDLGMALKMRRVAKMRQGQQAQYAATRDAINARRAARAEALAGRGGGAVEAVTDPSAILRRLDRDWLAGAKRAGTPVDESFLRQHGLLPQRTIRVNGETFHVSAPFRGDEGKTFVIAFHESPNGLVIPRTFYTSGEQGVWRAATGKGGLIQKGPVKYLYVDRGGIEREMTDFEAWFTAELSGKEYVFINKSATDLDIALQGTLSRWVGQRGVMEGLPKATADRAAYGHLEGELDMVAGREFSTFVNRADIERVLDFNAPGKRPNVKAGPEDSWTMTHHEYGEVQARVFRSEDGTLRYLVLRDARGRTWVPSVQDTTAAMTPFGTPDAAFKFSYGTPLVKPGTVVGSVPIPGSAYHFNPNYRNPLNALFDAPPVPARAPASGAPAVGGPARGLIDSRAATLLERGRGAAVRGGDTAGPGALPPNRPPAPPVTPNAAGENRGLFETQILHPNDLPAGAFPQGGRFYLLSDLENPFATAARALADERTMLTGIVTRSRANGGLSNGDANLMARLGGATRESQRAYINGLQYRGFIADHAYTGPDAFVNHPIAMLEAPERVSLLRFVDDYHRGVRVTGPNVIEPPSQSSVGVMLFAAGAPASAVASGAAAPTATDSGPSGLRIATGPFVDPDADDDVPSVEQVVLAPLPVEPQAALGEITQRIRTTQTRLDTLWTESHDDTNGLSTSERLERMEEYRTLQRAQDTLVRQHGIAQTLAEWRQRRRDDEAKSAAPTTTTATAAGTTAMPAPIIDPISFTIEPGRRRPDNGGGGGVGTVGGVGTIVNLADPIFGGGPFFSGGNFCCQTDVQSLVLHVTTTVAAKVDDDVPMLALAARSVGEFLRRLVAPPRSSSTRMLGSQAWTSRPARTTSFAQAAAPAGRTVTAVITSTGASQGEAFRLQVVNDGPPVQVEADGLVVEPLRRSAQPEATRQLQRTLGSRLANAATTMVEGYCLNFQLAPPSAGMLFRIAPPAVQERYRHAAGVLRAADRLSNAAGLHPDTDAKAYLESIKQYATWTRIEGWSLNQFRDAWLDRTKKTAAAMRRPWTNTMDQAIRNAAPGRWRDIQAILAAAAAP